MAELIVSIQAYCKILLHAVKHPNCAVNGVLLAEDNKSKDRKVLKFVDCVPLFHLTLSLSPMLEAALLQIDAYCKSRGYIIAGYYQANENLRDKELNNVAKTIGRRIQENCANSYIFMVDNERLFPDAVSEMYRIYSPREASWKEEEKLETVTEETLRVASMLLSSQTFREVDVVDFDYHFNDITRDWRNLPINDLLQKCT
ncbi:ER membrane protein complex subunit 8-like [Crassostrea angulata]|uniref:ER membrane protein complex subunit 8-like n=1 Tax=Magallana angulata TaxID=2784310 RepID=UPI0022B09DE5|nr:ER membrane protein complex subunit 8-like [Crassostrea angulata]